MPQVAFHSDAAMRRSLGRADEMTRPKGRGMMKVWMGLETVDRTGLMRLVVALCRAGLVGLEISV